MIAILTFLQQMITIVGSNADTITTIVLAIVAFLIYRKTSSTNAIRIQELASKLEKLHGEVATPVLGPETFKTEMEERNNVRNYLKNFRKHTKASRAYFFKFHNGTRYYTNQHQTRATCEVEVVNPGVAPITAHYQGTPVHQMSFVMDKLLREGGSLINVADIPEDYAMEAATYKQFGTTKLAVRPVNDPGSGMLLGFVGASWIDDPEVSPEEIEECLECAIDNIQTILHLDD
ncbi:hypothetical protein HN747_05085 [archaeon]|jgi:hypothetical protein|nr:hypothetical protein [archaeon]